MHILKLICNFVFADLSFSTMTTSCIYNLFFVFGNGHTEWRNCVQTRGVLFRCPAQSCVCVYGLRLGSSAVTVMAGWFSEWVGYGQ